MSQQLNAHGAPRSVDLLESENVPGIVTDGWKQETTVIRTIYFRSCLHENQAVHQNLEKATETITHERCFQKSARDIDKLKQILTELKHGQEFKELHWSSD